ncbi:MAG: FtsX-like permease family protein, partial [Candidatus Thorarchaeota archaeon]
DYNMRETSLTIVTTKDSINDNFEEVGFSRYQGISERYWITIDSTQILDNNVDTVYDSLDNLRRQFEQEALPYAIVSSFGLREAVQQYQAWALSMTTLSLAFSIPTVIMGILLIYYNTNLMSDETRRDIGTIKTRGASGWQAFNWIISSAVFTGLIGSVGAIALGTVSAILSSTVKVFFIFDLSQLANLALIVSPNALIAVFAFSFGVGLIVAFPIAIKSFLMTATEAHSMLERDVLLSRENLGSPLAELIILGISGYILIPILSLMSMMSYYGMFQIFFLILLIPMMGLFVISFSRLLARPVASTKASIIRRIGKRTAKVGTKVMSRTLLSYKKSEAMGVVFIAMVFVVGVLSGISASTAMTHTDSVFKFHTGSDIAITVKGGLENVTLDLVENITMVDGVASVCPILKVDQYVAYWSYDWNRRTFYNQTMTIYGVDPTAWLESAFWLPYFTLASAPNVAVSRMLENESFVISSFRPIDHYVGETFNQRPVYGEDISLCLRTPEWINITDMKIVDVLGASEEVYSRKYLQGEPDLNEFVVVNLDFLQRYLNTSVVNKFLVKIDPGANYTVVMRNLYDIAPNSFETIESAYTGIDEVQNSRAGQVIYGVYTLNVLFTIFYLSIGMVIVASVRIHSLRKQFSVLRALGTDAREITRSVLIDTALSVLIALGIGSLIGLILAAFSINMPLIYYGTTTLQMWQRLPVFLSIPWVTLGVIISVSFAFALLASYLVTKSTLKKNIAEEIQYTE